MASEEKEWRVGELVLVEPMSWSVDIIRAEDGHVMRKLLLTPETLPPRMKGKKVVWQLPTDGSTPNLGVYEVDRVIALFKEARKRGKKEKKLKYTELPPEPPIGAVALHAAPPKSRAKAPASSEAVSAAPPVIRYSKDALLALRSAPAAQRAPAGFPFVQTEGEGPAPPGIHPLPSPPATQSPAEASPRSRSRPEPLAKHQPPSGAAPVASTPGVTFSGRPQLRLEKRTAPMTTHLSKTNGGVGSSHASSVDMCCDGPAAEDIPLVSAIEAATALSGAWGGAPEASVPVTEPVIKFAAEAAVAEVAEEAAWKQAWKMRYLARLDSMAEEAWQNHKARQTILD